MVTGKQTFKYTEKRLHLVMSFFFMLIVGVVKPVIEGLFTAGYGLMKVCNYFIYLASYLTSNRSTADLKQTY
jgi:hypothetical protein